MLMLRGVARTIQLADAAASGSSRAFYCAPYLASCLKYLFQYSPSFDVCLTAAAYHNDRSSPVEAVCLTGLPLVIQMAPHQLAMSPPMNPYFCLEDV